MEGTGAFLDTNLLVLLVVGSIDRRLIERRHRISMRGPLLTVVFDLYYAALEKGPYCAFNLDRD